jgi:anti-sigma B factor antagonist
MTPAAGVTVTSWSQGSTEGLRVTGQIDVATVDAFALEIGEALSRAPQELVVDLSAVGFLGSGGLGALLDADRRARARGCRMIVVAGTGVVRRLLDHTNADRRLTVAP